VGQLTGYPLSEMTLQVQQALAAHIAELFDLKGPECRSASSK
jgi:hypothetical protein